LLLKKQGERDLALGTIRALEGERDEYREELTELEERLNEKEKEFTQLGGLHQAELHSLKEQERQAELEYDRVTRALKDALAAEFPVAFLLPLEQKWKERMAREDARRRWLAKREAIEPQISVLNERIFGPTAPQPEVPLSPEQREFFSARLAQEVRKLFWPPPPEASEELWFDLREHEVRVIEEQFGLAAHFSAETIKELTEAKARADAIRVRLKEKISSVADSDSLISIQREMNQIREGMGGLRAKIDVVDSSISHENKRLQELEGEITTLSRECEKSSRGQHKEELSKLYEKGVEEYIAKAAAQKADEVEVRLNELFISMANCRNFVRQVKLNRSSYELVVYDTSGRERPIETTLSAGQAQVLAMSFVAALAQASGRILPFIVDTPLGRLDVNHRRDVTEHFFKKCDPQIILLSTPTEINNCVYDDVQLDLLDMLRPRVARAYTLTQAAPEEAIVEQGYFGNEVS
jgi:DNA sulfur modification protein DndD